MIFITYPRSGVNFITKAIEQQTGHEIQYQHSFNVGEWVGFRDREIDESEDYIINIVRDPMESMASWISMQYEINDTPLLNNGHEKMLKAKSIPKYTNMYRKLLDLNNVVFINYQDFNEIDKLLFKLYEILNIKTIKNEFVDKHSINNENMKLGDKYLISSKNTSTYLKVLDSLKDQDLSQCYELYYKALDRCIKLDNEI
jgi:hypothetical protein